VSLLRTVQNTHTALSFDVDLVTLHNMADDDNFDIDIYGDDAAETGNYQQTEDYSDTKADGPSQLVVHTTMIKTRSHIPKTLISSWSIPIRNI